MTFAPFNIALQVIAAFAIFTFGYLALFVSLMICFFVCLLIAKGVYEGAKKVRTYAMKSSSDVDNSDHRKRALLIPALR